MEFQLISSQIKAVVEREKVWHVVNDHQIKIKFEIITKPVIVYV